MTKFKMLMLLALVPLLTIVYAQNRCLAISQAGTARTFSFVLDMQEMAYPAHWIVRDSSVNTIVSTCWSSSCDSVRGFYANITKTVNNGRPGHTALLSIAQMKSSMTYVLFDHGAHPKGGCNLLNYALPEKPVCLEPMINGHDIVISCSTKRVYPEGNCTFVYQTARPQDLNFSVTHKHFRMRNGYISYCTFHGIWSPRHYVNRAMDINDTRLDYRFKVLMSPKLPEHYSGNVLVSGDWSKRVKITPEPLSWNSRRNSGTFLSDVQVMNLTFSVRGNPAPWRYTLQKREQSKSSIVPRSKYRVVVDISDFTSDGRTYIVTLLSEGVNRLRPGKYRFILDNGVGDSRVAMSFSLHFVAKQPEEDSFNSTIQSTTHSTTHSTTQSSTDLTTIPPEGEKGKTSRGRLTTIVIPAVAASAAILACIIVVIVVLWRKKKTRRSRRRSSSSSRRPLSTRSRTELSRIQDVGHVTHLSAPNLGISGQSSGSGISVISWGAINPLMLNNMSPPRYEDVPLFDEPPPSYEYVQQLKLAAMEEDTD